LRGENVERGLADDGCVGAGIVVGCGVAVGVGVPITPSMAATNPASLATLPSLRKITLPLLVMMIVGVAVTLFACATTPPNQAL
jgi:hypothetical protein